MLTGKRARDFFRIILSMLSPPKLSIFLKNAAADKRFMGRSEVVVLLNIIHLVQVK